MRTVSRFALTMLMALALAPALLWGQGAAAGGTITGRITDATGGVVPNATVTVTDSSTKSAKTAATNKEGLFVFVNMPPATYDVTVDKQGFKEASVAGQELIVGQALTVNVSLEVGAATQTVEVTATPGADLQTLNSTMGTTLGGSTILTLPNQNRDATTLLVFQPTTAPTFSGTEGNTTGGQVAGSMSDQNSFALDGGQATDDLAGDNNYVAGNRGYAGPQAAIPTPVESIEEFKVATNNQTADFAQSAGGQVMLVTKRGTNQWHGSGYDYFQADWLDSAGWNLNVVNGTKVKQHQNRFGGAVGGPVTSKNFLGGRTYIYGNYEGRRYPYANGRYERLVPSDLLRQGIVQFRDSAGNVNMYNLANSTQCGAAGGIKCDPRGIGLNPTISQLWNQYMPQPNDCGNYGDHLNTCGYFAPLKLPIRDDFFVVRLDHDFGDKWHLMASYRFFRLDQPSTNQVDIGGLLPGDKLGVPASQSSNPGQPRYVVVGLTTTVTPTVTNDFHVSYLRNDWNWIRAGVPNGQLGIPGGLEVGGETSNPLAPMNFDTQDARFRTWNGHDWAYTDTVSWLKGNHFFQFGGEYRHWWDNHVRNDNVTGSLSQLVYQINKGSGLLMNSTYRPPVCNDTLTTGCITSTGGWDSLYTETLGFVGTASQLFARGGSDFSLTGAPYLEDHSITNAYSLYVNDSYKVKPNLTLNLGLNWGVQMPPYELNGVQDILTDASGGRISYNAFIDNVVRNANNGLVYNPNLGFEPIRGVGGNPKYPFSPWYGGFAPRLSIAWSPSFDSGFLGKLFGDRKTVIRGGYARIYDRTNAVNMVLTPLLGYGFGQPIRCNGAGIIGGAAGCYGTSGTNPTNGFRIGVDGNTAPFPEVSQTLPLPAMPGINAPSASVVFGLDSNWRPGSNDTIDFSIQRELPGQFLLETGYVGKWSKHIYSGMNTDGLPYMLKLGGQTFAQAYQALWQADHAGHAAAVQPWFETALSGSNYCKGFSSCTAAVQANEGSGGTGNITFENPYAMFADVDGNWNFGNCQGCLILQSDAQFAALDMSTTNGYANYQAGFVTVQKRAGHGLTLSSNLTWSHSLNTVGINQEYVEASPNNIYDLRYDYGPSPWDRRWVFNMLADYQLPFGKGQRFATNNGVLDKVIGGWSFAPIFTLASGAPIETYTGSCQEFGAGYIPWCSGAVPLVNTGTFGHSAHLAVPTDCNIGANNDPACGSGSGGNLFANPTAVYNSYRPALLGLDTRAYDYGNYYGQQRWNLDFTLAKQTQFTERVGATMYAQFLNAFNHMMYGDPGMNLQDPGNFGTLTGQYNSPRTIELGLRLFF
ncbi:MAG TPA: carboxypeptidase-like regulatory domain-containing protein [Terriglobia bacterium]|nr:carboxypeptidase-like regulatory domain-containing protein [Terriglobia bacterium]